MTEIKALEWYASSMTNDIGDKTTRYGASPMTNVFYWIFEGSNGFILQGRGTFPTVEAAQEAAHDEWSRRVRSCLVDISTPPARDAKIEALEKENATLKAGIKRLSDEEELINETGRDGMLSAVHIGARLAEAEELARAMEAEANQMREVSISHRNRAEALEESLKTVLASLVATTSLIIRAEDLKVKPSKAVASDKMFTQMLKDYDKATIAGRAALSTPPAAAVTGKPTPEMFSAACDAYDASTEMQPREHTQALHEALCAALSAAPSPVDSRDDRDFEWKLVPIKPTLEMAEKGAEAFSLPHPQSVGAENERAALIYRLMLGTAPSQVDSRDALERLEDKIEGLEADLDSAVEVAYRRGATEWTRLNYPDHFNRLSDAAASPVAFECSARKHSLPEPADCDWPFCGCDPYADKVIAALEESTPPSPVDRVRELEAQVAELRSELYRRGVEASGDWLTDREREW